MNLCLLQANNEVLDFFSSVVNWFRDLLPLDSLAKWLKTTIPVLGSVQTLIIVVALVVLIVWILISFLTQTIKRNAGPIVVSVIILAVIFRVVGIL